MPYEILPPRQAKEEKSQVGYEILPPKPSNVPSMEPAHSQIFSSIASLPARLASKEAGEAAEQYFRRPVETEPFDIKRYVSQIPIGALIGQAAKISPTGAAIAGGAEAISGLSRGGGYSFEELKAEHPELSREAYESAINELASYMPSLSGLLAKGEEVTGLPLEAKTLGQGLLQGASAALPYLPKTIASETGKKFMESQAAPSLKIQQKVPRRIEKTVEKSIPKTISSSQALNESKISESVPFGAEKAKKIGVKELREEGPYSSLRESKREITPHERLGEQISKYKIISKENTSKTAQKIIREQSENKYNQVNKLYDESEKLNKNIMGERPDLVNKTEERLTDLERQGARKYDAQAMDLLEDLRDFLKRGVVSNQDLIDRSRQIKKYLDFKFTHDPKNVFKPIVNDIEEEILRSAKAHPKAYKKYLDAKNAHAEWSERYNNENSRSFLDLKNKKYQGLYNKLLDEDVFSEVKPILEETTAGNDLANAIKRELVEKDLEGYIYRGAGAERKINFDAINSPELRKKLQSIDYLTKQEKDQVLSELRRWKNRRILGVTSIQKKKNPFMKNASKHAVKGSMHLLAKSSGIPEFIVHPTIDTVLDKYMK